ncbi:MAG: hypothetical protein ACOYB4_05500 [Methyloceanibacter sp.]
MIKHVLCAAVATAFFAVATLPVQALSSFPPGTPCKQAAKMKYPNDRHARHSYKKGCKAAWKASQGK